MGDSGFPPLKPTQVGRQGVKAGSTNLSKSFLMRLDRGQLLDLPNMVTRQSPKVVPLPTHMERYQVAALVEDMAAIRQAAREAMVEQIINQTGREKTVG